MTRDVAANRTRTIFTVGHSTHPLDTFVRMLTAHGVTTVADVRRYPRSRKFPHFNDESLAAELPRVGLRYASFLALGGRRRPAKDSPNVGWRSEGFRGYADYMMTPAFESALEALIRTAAEGPTAIMCAEAVPWRCHRSLISDALVVRGWRVMDITGENAATPHELTDFAKVEGTQIRYPATGAASPPRRKETNDSGLFD
jgi:uncharacterized protein (DUF488 family)